MPRTKRDHLKRKVANAMSYALDSLTWIKALESDFRPQHPEFADYLIVIGAFFVQGFEHLQAFWGKAWGDADPNWQAYSTVKGAGTREEKVEIYKRVADSEG